MKEPLQGLLDVGNSPIEVPFVLLVLDCLLSGIVLTHLFDDGKIRFELPSAHPIIIVLAPIELSEIEVLYGKVVIGTHLHVYVLVEPSKLQLLLIADDGFLEFFQYLIALAHLRVGETFGDIVQVLLGCIPQAGEGGQSFGVDLEMQMNMSYDVGCLLKELQFPTVQSNLINLVECFNDALFVVCPETGQRALLESLDGFYEFLCEPLL